MINYLQSLPSAVAQGLIWGIMALGLYITFRILDFSDLTVDGSLATGAAVAAVTITSGKSVWLALLLAVISGMLAGFATASFHIFLGIPPILSGILTQLILWSVNLKIMGKANVAVSARNWKVLVTQMQQKETLLVMVAFVAVIVAIMYWFFGTELGCSIRATGSNPNMSRAQGINTNLNKIIALMLSNGLVALSGAILCQYTGAADINMGKGAIVIGLAAIVIGKALFGKICPNFAFKLLTVVLGSIIYYLIYQTVIFIGLDTDLLKMLSALVVALFLGFPYLKKQYASRYHKSKGGKENAEIN